MDVESLMVYPGALKPETLISGWRILEQSGRGGFGAVYRVEDAARPGDVYALKMALRLGDPRAEREATLLMTRARHPNVVGCYGCGRWPHPKKGYRYIVMDYVEGTDLIGWVEGTNPTFHQLGAVFDKLALALGALNDDGTWHRDVKPDNIRVRSRDGEPILLDLGVGDYEGADTLTDLPLPPGTLHCRSPEALRFNRQNWGRKGAHYEYKPTDELYALGVTAYRVLTGHWPFPPDLERELLEDAILWRVPPSPDTVNPRIPPELSAIVARLLDKAPEARPQRGQELHEALVAASAFGKAEAWSATCFEWGTEQEGQPRRIRRPAPPKPPPALQPPEPPRPVHFVPFKDPAPVSVPGGKHRVGLAGWGLLLGLGVALVVCLYPTLKVGWPFLAQATHEVADRGESSEAQGAAVPQQADSTPAAVAAPAARLEESTPVKMKKATGEQPAKQQRSHPLKKAATAAACLHLSTGCAGVQARPFKEEKCPPEAIAAMARFKMTAGDGGVLIIDPRQPGIEADLGVYHDGPITSVLVAADGTLPPGTQLIGELWISSGRKTRAGFQKAYGRYTEARTPDGHSYPICLTLGDEDGLAQQRTSQPGAAELPRRQPFTVVDRFVFE